MQHESDHSNVSVHSENVRSPVARQRLAELGDSVLQANRIRRANISITLVDSSIISKLNRDHLGHRGPTDVITFALGKDHAGFLLADIYICVPVARTQASEHGVGVREEIARLVVHGVLHACGWEHPEGNDRELSPMWKQQEMLLERFWSGAELRS